MSDLKSVIAFFIGLVVFVFLVVFAISRIHLPKKATTAKTQVAATLTPTPTVSLSAKISPTPKPSLWTRFAAIFKKKPKTTPLRQEASEGQAPSAVPVQVVVETDNEALPTLQAVLKPDTGAQKVYVRNTVTGVTTIPETGAETLVIPTSLLLGSAGMWLRKRK